MHHRPGSALRGMAGQREELAAAQGMLTGLAAEPVLARMPAGVGSPLTDPVLHGLGLRHASWSRRGLDTRLRDPASVLRRLLAGVQCGDILLLHDGNSARTACGRAVVMEALRMLLPVLAGLGLRSVTVTEEVSACRVESGGRGGWGGGGGRR